MSQSTNLKPLDTKQLAVLAGLFMAIRVLNVVKHPTSEAFDYLLNSGEEDDIDGVISALKDTVDIFTTIEGITEEQVERYLQMVKEDRHMELVEEAEHVEGGKGNVDTH